VEALADPVVARLITIPGVDAIAGMAIVAAVGDFYRFPDADRLVAYVGLNPKVRQSGNSAPVHGRISKAGRAQVRGVLVEAAWSASRAPGAVAGVLPPDQGPPRLPDRRGRHRPQNDRLGVASGD
jgi:transposase